MAIYTSNNYHGDKHAPTRQLFGRQRSLHSILGGGKVANILLWRNRKLSAAILIGFTTVWFLFEVVEYPFVTLLCNILIIAMLSIFIWNTAARLISWNPPNVRQMQISESTCRYLFSKFNRVLLIFFEISSGNDLKLFFMAIACLWMLSVTGTCISSLNLLYLVFLGVQTLPVLYEHYGSEADYIATKGSRDVKKLYNKFESKVLNKIPRGPVKEKRLS